MSKAFKKKKQGQLSDELTNKLDFLLGSQLIIKNSQSTKIQRSLILKCAMFWDTKSRVERIKSLVLSNMNIHQFEDSEDFKIEELTAIQQLSLSKNSIIHLQPISVLDTLITLNINYNKVYNLAPLQALLSLQQLYASNNEINNIDSLKCLENLRILNVYKNKISAFERAFQTLERLKKLQDLDIEQNACFNEQSRRVLIKLPLARLNDKIISKAERQQVQNKSIVNMSSSCVINPLNVSTMRDTKTSFFNPSSKSIKMNKMKELQQRLEQLQDDYMKIDDEFEEEIVKNVQLKSEYHQKLLKIKQAENVREENQYKTQEIKLMKRKAKQLKQNLFKIESKGSLLREIFELQTQSIPRKINKKQVKTPIIWSRRFDCDDVILIEDDTRYFQEDRQLADLLQNNSNTLEQLRRQLQSFY